MYSINKRNFIVIVTILLSGLAHAQEQKNFNSLETGVNIAGSEALYHGAYAKFTKPLSQQKQYFTFSLSLTTYSDFSGESEAGAYLRKDMDMRIIPAVQPGYSINLRRFQLLFELPVGCSIAISNGELVNEKVGFKRKYSNKEIFWHYGLSFSPRYRLNNKNQISLLAFIPLVPDKARSGYIFGIGWNRTFKK